MRAGDQMGLVSTISSESTLVNPSSPAAQSTPAASTAAAPAGAAPALDLNSPPPSSGSSRSSSTSSSSSPPRSATSAPPPPPPSSPAPPPSTARKPATPAASTAQSDPDPLKQQLASTTFIQADVLSFRELVQRHTGAAEDAQDKLPVTLPARQSGAKNNQSQVQQQAAAAAGQNDNGGVVAPPPPHGTPHGTNPFRRHHMSRLHERKVNNLRNLEVSRASPFKRTGCSPRGAADGPSPKLLYAASGMLPSPVTPLSSDASFETTSNPSPVQQMPLTPTETLRREFASSLHCGGGGEESQSSQIKGLAPASSPGYVNGGGVLERFPFLHHHQSFHHHQQQQQQMSPVVMHTGLQLAAHYQQQQQNHIIYEQHHHHQQQQQQQNHVMYEQQQQQMMMIQQREPELLDLFPVHATSLKESRC